MVGGDALRRMRRPYLSTAVDVTSMSESHHNHQQHVVLDCVDDPVVADTDAKPRSAPNCACTRRARILSEEGDGTLNAAAGLRIELA